MSHRRTGYACPICDRAGVTSYLYETPPALATLCEGNSEHKWTDSNELRNLQPRKLDVPRPVIAVQQNRVPLTVQVPVQVDAALRSKYGEALNENLISLLQYGTQPDFLVLNSEDLNRIQERTQVRPQSSGELFGTIFQMGEEIQELKLQAKQQQRTRTIQAAGTGVLVDLADYLPKAVGKAAEAGVDVTELLSNYIKLTLENDWAMV